MNVSENMPEPVVESSEEFNVESENKHRTERPILRVRLAKVLSIVSLALGVMAWLYAPGYWLYDAASFLRPWFPEYLNAVCNSTIPLAAIAAGIWAVVLGRRECGTMWFVAALISIFVSGNLVVANFYTASFLWSIVPGLAPGH